MVVEKVSKLADVRLDARVALFPKGRGDDHWRASSCPICMGRTAPPLSVRGSHSKVADGGAALIWQWRRGPRIRRALSGLAPSLLMEPRLRALSGAHAGDGRVPGYPAPAACGSDRLKVLALGIFECQRVR